MTLATPAAVNATEPHVNLPLAEPVLHFPVGDRWRQARIDRFDRIARIATRLFKVAAAWIEDEREEQIYRFAGDDSLTTAGSPWPATLPGLPADLEQKAAP